MSTESKALIGIVDTINSSGVKLIDVDCHAFEAGDEVFVKENNCYYTIQIGENFVVDNNKYVTARNLLAGQWVRTIDVDLAADYSSGGFTLQTIVFGALDPVAGNDTTGVFSTTLATATASPYKTITAVLAKLPRFGNMATFIGLMKAGTYNQPDGVTIDNLDLTDFTGYKDITFRGSDFTNTTSDKLRVAGAVVSGTSTQGYTLVANTITPSAVDFTVTPVKITSTAHGLVTGEKVSGRTFSGGATLSNGMLNGYWTVTVLDANNFTLDNSKSPPGLAAHTYNAVGTFIRWTLTDKSGSPVSLPAFPALVGKRFRFDTATATAGFRDASFQIIDNDATHLIFQSSIGAIGATDFGYFEEPSVVVGTIRTSPSFPATSAQVAVSGNQFVGIKAANILSRGTVDRFTFCEQTSSTNNALSVSNLNGGGQFLVSTSWLDEVTGAARQVGTGMRVSANLVPVSGNFSLGSLFHIGTAGFQISNSVVSATIQNGYYASGIVLNNCGGRGGGANSVSGSPISITAANLAFARGPRINGTATLDGLRVIASSVYLSGADVSNATDPRGAGIRALGFCSSISIDNVSGHNNYSSLSTTVPTGGGTEAGVSRARISITTSGGNFGLYSSVLWTMQWIDNASYNDNIGELLFSPFRQGMIDSFDNALFDPTASPINFGDALQLARVSGYYHNGSASTIPRGMLLKARDAGATLMQAILAIADTEDNTRKTIGVSLGTNLSISIGHFAGFGQISYVYVDLTGGHAAAASGNPVYLSQTRAGYAQTDKPVSGQILQVGVAMYPSNATTGLTPVYLTKG